MKDLSIDGSRKPSLTSGQLSVKSISPLPTKPPSPRFTTVLPTTPGAYVDSPPPPSQTVYLQGAVPIATEAYQNPERNPYQQAPRPSQNSPPKQFVVQPMHSSQYVQPSQFNTISFSQAQFVKPSAEQQLFTRPVPAVPPKVDDRQRYEEYSDFYTIGAQSNPSSQSRTDQFYYHDPRHESRDYESAVSDDIIMCAFCQCGVKPVDMNSHLDSNCRLHVARMNSG